ncbi:phosphatidylglycerophosphatase and protein-tyrosine phosphatase 1-like [Mytilus trossulus]|uniref:phosphatidylglycerophosphatase and protein-tyrosine phosphatase 1-like n=1 Tax=Mytilus trossulus TaxID=6551 RepID=UPI003007B88F
MSGSLFGRIAFYPTLYYNKLMTKITNRQWYNRIDETVVLGALPLKENSKKLVEDENIKGVISLNEDWEMKGMIPTEKEWKDLGVDQLFLQTVDYVGTPTQENINKAVQFIMKYRKREESVYVHCKAGRTRSTTIVACYLVHVNKWTPDEAVEFIKTKRSHVWLRDKQIQSIHTYFENQNSFSENTAGS